MNNEIGPTVKKKVMHRSGITRIHMFAAVYLKVIVNVFG